RIDGVLIQSARLGDSAHLGAFVTGLVPCVFMDRRHPGSGRNVSMRDGDAGRLACEHFLELGHRSLGHLAGPADLDTVVRRRDGFVGRARSAGIEPVVLAAGLSEEEGYRAMRALLERDPAPTAVYIANINQALGAAAAVRESGRRVPEELELEPPRRDEVLVRLRASGICRSDLSLLDGKWPAPLPMVLGHEGAGTVAVVGEGVDPGRVGEHVVLTFTPSCGRCRFC